MAETPPRGKQNALFNRDETRVSGEVFDIYRFLHGHPTMAPNRRKDVLRAAIGSTPFGFIFRGLVSVGAAELIDARLRDGSDCDPCEGLQRDHFQTWKETAEHLFSRALMPSAEFWEEMKRRNEVVLLRKDEHALVGGFQRKGHGLNAYSAAGVHLIRVDPRAVRLRGNRAGLVKQYWSSAAEAQIVPLPPCT